MRLVATIIPLVALALIALPAICAAAPGGQIYRVVAPSGQGLTPHGWGVFATVQGRSIDLRSRDLGWSDDPQTRPGDIQAGLGWRRNRVSAVLGFQQADYGPHDYVAPGIDPRNEPGPRRDGGGVIGLGFSLLSR